MDSVTITIGVIVIALCTLPFVFMARKRKKEESQMLAELTAIAEKENCKITLFKLFGNSIIGIDETANLVFFFRKIDDKRKEIAHFVNLNDIQNCRIINSSHSVGEKTKVIVVDKIELSLLPKDKNRQKVSFEFFNADDSSQLNGELQLATEWEERINSRLNLNTDKK